MAARTRSDEELRLREVLKRQIEDQDRSYILMGHNAEKEWDTLCKAVRLAEAGGKPVGMLPETWASFVSSLRFLMHEMGRSHDYIGMKRREIEETQRQLRAEVQRQKGETDPPHVVAV